MDNLSDLSKRRTSFELPKATDAGLSEWTSRIKAIQKEVDEDAEDEQRRLQAEIEASRLERAKRRNTVSVDLTKNDTSGIFSPPGNDRNKNSKDNNRFPGALTETKLNSSSKDPISLAAFIGGRATGPYLTKSAPQVNTYDTDLFELSKPDGPHPIFGVPTPRSPSQTHLSDKPVTPLSRSTTVVSSSVNRIAPSQKSALPPQTMLLGRIEDEGSDPRLTKSQRAREETGVTSTLNTSLSQRQALPGLTNSRYPSLGPPSTPNKPINISQVTPTPSILTKTPPSPARPIQLQVNNSPPAATASPAFLRPIPTTEELHPSLTKLQARGFVEQRVKASTPLRESSVSNTEERTDAAAFPNLRKRPSVLDRWQPASPSPSQTSTSQSWEKPKLAEQVKPVGKTSATGPVNRVSNNGASGGVISETNAAPIRLPGMASPNLQHKAHKPIDSPFNRKPGGNASGEATSETEAAPIRLPGMASPDLQYKAHKPFIAPSNVTAAVESGVSRKTTPFMASTTLNHPTRGRPKKPKKEKNTHNNENDSDDPQQLRKPTESIESIESRVDRDTINEFPFQDTAAKLPVPVVESTQPSAQTEDSKTIPTAVESPRSPNRHGRIPSTGQRATVMDVAQALLEHDQTNPELSDKDQKREDTVDLNDEEEIRRLDVKARVALWGRNQATAFPVARKASYERYSIASTATLPPLVEVQTPAETPQASLSRGALHQERVQMQSIRALQEQLRTVDENGTSPPKIVEETTADESAKSARTRESSQQDESGMVELVFQPKLPPPFNPQQVMKEAPLILDTTAQTISTEVHIISGGVATPVTREQNIFYDTEVIVVIHRSKPKSSPTSSELVSNQAWIWRGKNSNWKREERKAVELAGMFDKKAVHCVQGSEPVLLILVLGGVLATRQGTRSHWTSENTTMHRVHRVGDCMFVDEIDLGVWNLCSANSCCLSVLGTLYVWHGRGSSEDERKVAVTYATSISNNSMPVMETEEGTEDEMFWMILGRAKYADAHHWKFRDQLDRLGARVYAIDSSKSRSPVQVLPTVSAQELQGGIFVIDCRLEVYVLINSEARGKRADIQLGLILGESISSTAAHKRPFTPPVHVVVLPSKLPLELRAALRLCDEGAMNGGEVPDHMNLVTLSDAVDHMQRSVWPRSRLNDPKFLPVGVEPSMFRHS